jgi:6-phosphogluconolactonase
VFDLVLLGLGDDGHTASIFPDNLALFDSDNSVEVAVHPTTGQKRITLTGKTINQAESLVFLVTGTSKAQIISEILNKKAGYQQYPASHIAGVKNPVCYYLDKESAALL